MHEGCKVTSVNVRPFPACVAVYPRVGGECNEEVCVGCWLSKLTSPHCREVESNLLYTLSAITAFSFAHHIPSPLLLVMCFTCPNPTPGLALHRTASAQIGSTAPPLATLAPQNALVVYIISVCCVACLGTC